MPSKYRRHRWQCLQVNAKCGEAITKRQNASIMTSASIWTIIIAAYKLLRRSLAPAIFRHRNPFDRWLRQFASSASSLICLAIGHHQSSPSCRRMRRRDKNRPRASYISSRRPSPMMGDAQVAMPHHERKYLSAAEPTVK